MTPNARFWQWHNGGWIKITLKPGQSLSTNYGGPTDEGYSYAWERWTHEGDRVVRESGSQSCDCDGRLDEHWEGECLLEDLKAINQFALYEEEADKGIYRPEWKKISAGQRDYSAEAMGY